MVSTGRFRSGLRRCSAACVLPLSSICEAPNSSRTAETCSSFGRSEQGDHAVTPPQPRARRRRRHRSWRAARRSRQRTPPLVRTNVCHADTPPSGWALAHGACARSSPLRQGPTSAVRPRVGKLRRKRQRQRQLQSQLQSQRQQQRQHQRKQPLACDEPARRSKRIRSSPDAERKRARKRTRKRAGHAWNAMRATQGFSRRYRRHKRPAPAPRPRSTLPSARGSPGNDRGDG